MEAADTLVQLSVRRLLLKNPPELNRNEVNYE